ncbi:DUF1835 domain-containing protein [Neobacillus kokaensis]|uniref:DUF1835 domain-containing protein n=1 Tax=Neobacillus kokaensis TaxID=2759023 RepID=A0ABQ3N1Q8_9BACI|nr:DUF1835 domain-containing protein [Neobacillus kokaensis]GHH97918.1 hypothetical protein AM1BK_14610 [Neobacillus kokaensis]
MLHIVNGDSVGGKLKKGKVPGDILVWREIYTEGPVFMDPLSRRFDRADYLEKMLGIPRQEFINLSESQEQQLNLFKKYEEVVLWFEYDLFDQTMLCYLLHWFSKQSLERTKLNLLCIGSFPGIKDFRGLGQLSVEQLKSLLGSWHPIEPSELDAGKRVWEAYTSSHPLQLVELLQEDTSALPFVKEAFRFHMSRFPSVQNGLGSLEKRTLELVQQGINNPIELFQQVAAKFHIFGMGDLQYWCILKRMSDGPRPLIRIEDMEFNFPSYTNPEQKFQDSRVIMTKTGQRVLDGKEDWIALNDINNWFGGVHITGKDNVWRWDDIKETIVKF